MSGIIMHDFDVGIAIPERQRLAAVVTRAVMNAGGFGPCGLIFVDSACPLLGQGAGLRHQLNPERTNPTLDPMPLTLWPGELDLGRASVSYVFVGEHFSWEFGAGGLFGHGWVGSVSSGLIR